MNKSIITGLVGMLTYASAVAVEPVIRVSKPVINNDPVANAIANDPRAFMNQPGNEDIKRAHEAVERMKAETDKMVADYQKRTNTGKVEVSKKVVQRPVQNPLQSPIVQTKPQVQYSPSVATKATQNTGTNLISRLESQLIRHEGYKESLYYDKYGRPHVGIGFNLTRPDARKKLAEVGANYDSVMGGAKLNNAQIMKLFRTDVAKCKYDAKRIVGDKQPQEVLDIVTNLVYNMGADKFDDFKSTIKYIKLGNYRAAADRMKASDWYKQVPSRARELTNEMRNLSVKYPYVAKSQKSGQRRS